MSLHWVFVMAFAWRGFVCLKSECFSFLFKHCSSLHYYPWGNPDPSGRTSIYETVFSILALAVCSLHSIMCKLNLEMSRKVTTYIWHIIHLTQQSMLRGLNDQGPCKTWGFILLPWLLNHVTMVTGLSAQRCCYCEILLNKKLVSCSRKCY